MWRFLAGVGSTLLLVTAGFLIWQGRADTAQVIPAAPPAETTEAAQPDALALLGDSGPPTATEKTREQKRFSRYDKDKNGAVAREEYLAARRKAFAKLDVNGDGHLSFEEHAVKALTKFATADRDRSGTLTPAEFLVTRVARKAPGKKCPRPSPLRRPEPAPEADSDDS
ncbi:MAG: EF-hand domain-containing protein [Sphingomonadaceae bacterium]